MRRFRSILLYALCAPWDLAVLLAVAPLITLVGRCRPRVRRGALWLDVRAGSLLHRRWRYSTTVGHVVLLQPGLCGTEVEEHELVHVRQHEGAVCSAWVALLVFGVGSLFSPWASAALLALLAPWWSYAGASLAAFLRDEHPYLDNHFERHARAEVLSFGELES